jgi:hypothetical protein
MPANQPRFQLFANRLQVDETGLSLVLGMRVARRGGTEHVSAVHRIERPIVPFDRMPRSAGLQMGLGGAALEGITAAATDAGSATVDVRDLNMKEFARLGDLTELRQAIPDLARYDERTEVRTLLHAVEPFFFAAGYDSNSFESQMVSPTRLADMLSIRMPHLRLVVQTKSQSDPSTWSPVAEFDMSVSQQMRVSLQRPTFETRQTTIERPTGVQVSVDGRLLPEYDAIDTTLHPEHMGRLFEDAWNATGRLQLAETFDGKDTVVGQARFRLNDIGWFDPYLMKSYLPARSRLKNDGLTPFVYEIRGPFTPWGGPYTLPPGQSHDFTVPYPLTVRRAGGKDESTSSLPMGAQLVLEASGDGADRLTLHSTSQREEPR